ECLKKAGVCAGAAIDKVLVRAKQRGSELLDRSPVSERTGPQSQPPGVGITMQKLLIRQAHGAHPVLATAKDQLRHCRSIAKRDGAGEFRRSRRASQQIQVDLRNETIEAIDRKSTR